MKLSLDWLKDYVALPADLDLKQLAYDLTMSTVEVEEARNLGNDFQNIILARVLEAKQHPDAERLKVCQVDCGSGEVSEIVCGATNVEANMLVALAKPGARVRLKGSEEPVELKATKIRGIKSNGMLCASDELGLSELLPQSGEMQIMNLSAMAGDTVSLGQGIAEFLGLQDIIIEIDNKSLTNRPDLWGHYGMARELACIYKLDLKPLELLELPEIDMAKLQIEIEDQRLCYRYIGVLLDQVKNGAAPYWMRRRLHSIGQRPINLLVDLTNYVMFALGQPLHVFDQRKLSGKSIYVRNARPQEPIKLLDDSELSLNHSELVITDQQSAQALAGIMGGSEAAAEHDTTSVLLEAASFQAVHVRRSASRLAKRSESSMRFEKGIDSPRAELGSRLFLTLLKQIQPEVQLVCAQDQYPTRPEKLSIVVSHEFLLSRIGENISYEQVQDILERLGFTVSRSGSEYHLIVPDWRATGDVSIPEDIVEEVARMFGYDNLNFHVPSIRLEKAILQPRVELEHQIRRFLSGEAGMQEVFSYPWAELKYLEAAGFDPAQCLQMSDPPSDQHACVSPSLIPNMIFAVRQNLRHFKNFSLYEVSRAVNPDQTSAFSSSGETLPSQDMRVAGALAAESAEKAFFELKGILEGLFGNLWAEPLSLAESLEAPAWLASGAALQIVSGKMHLGFFGLINRSCARKLGFDDPNIALFEFNLDKMNPDPSSYARYSKLPQFPVVDYDLAILFDADTRWEKIERCAKGAHKLIRSVRFLEEYRGKQIPTGKKSISFQLTMLDENATLTSDQIDKVASRVLKQLANDLGGELRTE